MTERRMVIDAMFSITTFDRPPEDDRALVAQITDELSRRLPGIITGAEVDPKSVHTYIAGPGSPED